MKFILTFIFALIFCIVFGQEYGSKEFLNEKYKKSLELLKKSELDKALRYLSLVKKLSDDKKITDDVLYKIDSLKPIVQKNKIERIQGYWQLVKEGSNWGYTEEDEFAEFKYFLDIENKKATYYRLNTKTDEREITKTEILKFYTIKDLFYESYTSFMLENNYVWNIDVGKKGFLNKKYIGESTEKGFVETVCGNPHHIYKKAEIITTDDYVIIE